VELAVNSSVN